MFIHWKDFTEASLSFTESYKKNDNPNKNSQGKQTQSWMDLLAIIQSHRWGFPGVTKKHCLKEILQIKCADEIKLFMILDGKLAELGCFKIKNS